MRIDVNTIFFLYRYFGITTGCSGIDNIYDALNMWSCGHCGFPRTTTVWSSRYTRIGNGVA